MAVYKVYSSVLEDTILFAEHTSNIREEDKSLVMYTKKELLDIVRRKPSHEELRRMHEIKKTFGGEMEPADNITLFGA